MHSLKVACVHDACERAPGGGGVDEGIVGGGVTLDAELSDGKVEVLNLRAEPLRRGAERISVLAETDVVVVLIALRRVAVTSERGVAKKVPDVSGNLLLAGVGTRDIGNPRIKWLCASDGDLDGHGGEDLRELGKHRCLGDDIASDGA